MQKGSQRGPFCISGGGCWAAATGSTEQSIALRRHAAQRRPAGVSPFPKEWTNHPTRAVASAITGHGPLLHFRRRVLGRGHRFDRAKHRFATARRAAAPRRGESIPEGIDESSHPCGDSSAHWTRAPFAFTPADLRASKQGCRSHTCLFPTLVIQPLANNRAMADSSAGNLTSLLSAISYADAG